MKLSTVSWLTAIVIFVATAPHGVAAWLVKSTPNEAGSVEVFAPARMVISPKIMAKSIAKDKVYKMFDNPKHQWRALARLWGKESAWNHQAKNPNSSAYGIAQVLGTPRNSTIEYQVNKGLEYIVHRYGTPKRAWAFWLRNGWY